jgi:ribonuclease J
VLRRKLFEAELDDVPITEIPMSGRFSVGPFEIELITLTHSIPEPNAVVIRTPLGNVLHTGDWKLDPAPVVGATTDEEALRRLGAEGALAMVCDSTNVFVEGESGSESDLQASLHELVGRCKQRVAVACFASNVARLETIARVAAAHGRHTALIGRSLWRIFDAARENGYLRDLPPFVREHDAGYLPREKTLLICTGSQGEPRSALARIAREEHPQVTLDPGDTVIFSSRVIPGNDESIGRLQNDLVRLGVEVVTDREHFVHVSGHPAREELAAMYRWVRPRIAIPVHGEMRHLVEHARFAESCQISRAIVAENGALVRLAPDPPGVIDHAPVGRLGLDGSQLTPLDSAVMRSRHRIQRNGAAVATLVVDREGRLQAEPQLSVPGLLDAEGDDAVTSTAIDAIRSAIEALPRAARLQDDPLREAARIAIRRTLHTLRGKKPPTEVHLVRIGGGP